jgi:hypothetical protein
MDKLRQNIIRWVTESFIWDWLKDTALPWLVAHKSLGVSAVSAITGVWAWLTGLPTVYIFVSALAASASTVWLINGIRWAMGARRQADGNPAAAEREDVIDSLWGWVRSEVGDVHFGTLYTDDPYIGFNITISNPLPYGIEITGIRGSANINRTACTRDARLPSGFRQFVIPAYTLRLSTGFFQPLAEAHATTLQTLIDKGAPIGFDLSPIEWIGAIVSPAGKEPFPERLPCAVQFEVDTARVWPESSTASIQPVRLAGQGNRPPSE